MMKKVPKICAVLIALFLSACDGPEAPEEVHVITNISATEDVATAVSFPENQILTAEDIPAGR